MESHEQQIAQILRALRAEAGLSREELAVKAHLSFATIVRAEIGNKKPTLATLIALSGVFGVPVSRLLGEVAA